MKSRVRIRASSWTIPSLAIAASLVFALSISGCGGSGSQSDSKQAITKVTNAPSNLVKLAKREATLNLYYATSQEVTDKWIKGFEEKYNIEVKEYRANTSSLLQKVKLEAQAGKGTADTLVFSGQDTWNQAVKEDLLAKYTPKTHPNIPRVVTKPHYMYGLYSYAYGTAWNTNRTSEVQQKALESKGLKALLDPSLKGKLGTGVPEGSTVMYGVYYRIANDPDLGWAYLKKLAAQDPKLYQSVEPLTSQLVAGQLPVAITANDTVTFTDALKGAPVRFAYTNPAVSVPMGVGVANKAPHPYAARLFSEWATGAKADASLAALYNGIPTNTNASSDNANGNGAASKESLSWYDPPKKLYADFSTKEEFLKGREGFMERWDRIFGYQG